jgi:hypothetical protein
MVSREEKKVRGISRSKWKRIDTRHVAATKAISEEYMRHHARGTEWPWLC